MLLGLIAFITEPKKRAIHEVYEASTIAFLIGYVLRFSSNVPYSSSSYATIKMGAMSYKDLYQCGILTLMLAARCRLSSRRLFSAIKARLFGWFGASEVSFLMLLFSQNVFPDFAQKCTLRRRIGTGGFASVFEASSPLFDSVAIKVIATAHMPSMKTNPIYGARRSDLRLLEVNQPAVSFWVERKQVRVALDNIYRVSSIRKLRKCNVFSLRNS